MRACLGFMHIEIRVSGSGFEPGTFGTEGGYLASELWRQMREPISISIEVVTLDPCDVIGLTLSEVRQRILVL